MSIADAFNRIRYAAEWEPRGHEPIGFHVPGTDITPEWPRNVAADYLRERSRDDEADAAQHHDGPLLLHQGKVTKGRYDDTHLRDRMNQLNERLHYLSDGLHEPPVHVLRQWEYENTFPPAQRDLPADHVAVENTNGEGLSHVHFANLSQHVADAYQQQWDDADESPWRHAPAEDDYDPVDHGRLVSVIEHHLRLLQRSPVVFPEAYYQQRPTA